MLCRQCCIQESEVKQVYQTNYGNSSNNDSNESNFTLQGSDEVTAGPENFKPNSLLAQSVISPK